MSATHPTCERLSRLHDAATPHEVPGWDRLAASRSFYVAANWLRYADADRVAASRYLGCSADGRLVAAVSAHWAPGEVDPDYVAARALDVPQGAPGLEDGVVTLGGRRGFLSGVLIETQARPEQLADLIEAAAGERHWWWPYLSAADADLVLAAGGRGGDPPPGVHLVGADCVIDVAGTSIDDHVAALPTRQRRTNFRREQRRFDDSGLTLRQVRLGEWWEELGPLLAAVQHKYGHRQSADEMRGRLKRQGEQLDAHAVVFACLDGDAPVGFALAYRWGSELALRVVGFDYGGLVGVDEYAQLAVHAPLRYCYEHGLRRLHLGTESYEAKCRRGARARPLWAVTSLPGACPGGIEHRARQLASAMPAHEAFEFRALAESACGRWTRFLRDEGSPCP
jgi:hypothetical protein